jgi:Beta-galactosidase.
LIPFKIFVILVKECLKSLVWKDAWSMSKRTLFLFIFLSLVTISGSQSIISAPSTDQPYFTPETVTPGLLDFNKELLVNPGKGWIIYGHGDFWQPGVNSNPFEGQTEETWAAASVGYYRFVWNDIQPNNETEYDWSPIDKALAECKARGKKFAFGIMNANSSTNWKYMTPKWVFDAGAQYVDCTVADTYDSNKTYHQLIPVWNDPVFIGKLRTFVNALAARYDGNPDVAFIDIRSYGNWGENHVRWGITGSQPISTEDFEKYHLQTYLDAFHKTLLVTADSEKDIGASDGSFLMSAAAFQWACDHGIAGRNDGIIFPRDNKGGPTGALKLRKYKDRLPVILEFWGPFKLMRDRGYWNDFYLRDDVETAYATYCVLGYFDNDGAIMYKEKKDLVAKIGNRMGYYFILKKASFDNQGNLCLQWQNKGVAPIFIPAYLAVALIDPNTGAVVEKQWLADSNPRNWSPGKTVSENATFSFSAHSGTYKLAIGLFSDKESANPDIQLGIQGKNPQGWYVLSDMPESK